jgi:hypothetical protein
MIMDNKDTTIVETHRLTKRYRSGLIRPTNGTATVAGHAPDRVQALIVAYEAGLVGSVT